jgi:hypothetical protein
MEAYSPSKLLKELTGRDSISDRDDTALQSLWATLQEVSSLEKSFSRASFEKQLMQISSSTGDADVLSAAAKELKGEPHGELAAALDNNDRRVVQQFIFLNRRSEAVDMG